MQSDNSNKIIFFEVQEWEKNLLASQFPEAELVEEKLTDENVNKYISSEVVSCFIYSSIGEEIIKKLPNLKLITSRSTGFDHIDVNYCSSHNILVMNVPEYGSDTVAEYTFALILNLTRKIYQSVNQSKNLIFNHEDIRGMDLHGKTIGILGLGKIGLQVLSIAEGFGMKALVYTRSINNDLAEKRQFSYVDLNTLFKESDILTLHLPYNQETKHIVNKGNITNFKKGSYLVNTARGGLIETEAVVLGLNNGILAGVALDVLEEEKEFNEEAALLTKQLNSEVNLKNLVYNHILINHPKVLITPHNAFNSQEALLRITTTTVENIKSYQIGSPINLVQSERVFSQ